MATLRAVPPQTPPPTRRPLRILVADDDRDTALVLATILRDEGHTVNTVLRGDEVLEVERLLRPDAVILDINLPGTSGYALAREIRQRHNQLAPLLIAVSGTWRQESERLVGEAVGFDQYLLKPCEPQQIIQLLEPLRSAGSGSAGRRLAP